MDGWIKLHRQVIDNDIFRYDETAWHLFECLLLSADRKTGEYRGGRFRLAELSGINPNTLKSAIERLRKAQMVTTSSTNKYTVFSICNWSKYQQPVTRSDTSKTPAKHQQNTTITRNKNIDTKVSIEPKLKSTLMDFIENRKQLKRPMTRRAIELLLNKLEILAPQNVPRQIAILNQSIEHGWIGVFELKNNETQDKVKEALRLNEEKRYVNR